MHIHYVIGPKGAFRQRKTKTGQGRPSRQLPPGHKKKSLLKGNPHHTHFLGVGAAHEAAKQKKAK